MTQSTLKPDRRPQGAQQHGLWRVWRSDRVADLRYRETTERKLRTVGAKKGSPPLAEEAFHRRIRLPGLERADVRAFHEAQAQCCQ